MAGCQCHVSGVWRALGHGKVAGGGVTVYSAGKDSFVAEVTRPRTILCHLLSSVACLSLEKGSGAHISWLRFASARLAKPRLSAATKTRHSSHVTRHFFPPWLGFWLVERRMKKRRQAAALQNGCWRFASSPIFSPRWLVFWWKKAPTVIDRRDNFSSKCSGAQPQEHGFVKALCRVIGPVGTRGSRVRFFLKRASEPLAPTPDPGCSRWKLVEYRAGTA